MLVSESWLREWVSAVPESAELADRLTLSGMEVDTIKTAGPILNNQRVLVGEVVEVTPHPNADRLQICTVDTGAKRRLKIICGAANARAGLKTAVATNRARLPEMQVLNREIRGIKSQGMLCSALELGLSEQSDGIIEFDADAPVGTGVSDYLDLEDRVLELELTPNRGDCLGVLGIAREIATLTREKLRKPDIPKVKPAIKSK